MFNFNFFSFDESLSERKYSKKRKNIFEQILYDPFVIRYTIIYLSWIIISWIWSVKKVLLKILQNSQGNNSCATGSFLIKLQVSGCNFIKKRFWRRCFPVNYAKCLRTPLSPNTTDDCFWLGTSGTRKNEFLYL